MLADRDHVVFDFEAKHDSAAVCDLFRGYSGYPQADAHAIYDMLHRGRAVEEKWKSRSRADDDSTVRILQPQFRSP